MHVTKEGPANGCECVPLPQNRLADPRPKQVRREHGLRIDLLTPGFDSDTFSFWEPGLGKPLQPPLQANHLKTTLIEKSLIEQKPGSHVGVSFLGNTNTEGGFHQFVSCFHTRNRRVLFDPFPCVALMAAAVLGRGSSEPAVVLQNSAVVLL